MAQPHASEPLDAQAVGHVVPPRILLIVCVSLLLLTWLTVAATWVNLGALNLWIALGIATIKACLVVLYFMHLRYDRPFNVMVLLASLFFLLLFIGGSLTDTVSYHEEIDWHQIDLTARQ